MLNVNCFKKLFNINESLSCIQKNFPPFMQERIKNLKKAIEFERQEELDRFADLINEQSIKERIKAGITLYPVEFTSEKYTAFEDLLLEFKINENQDPYQFSSNGKVSLFSENNSESIEGVVANFKNNILSVQLGQSEKPDWIKSGKLGLNALPDTRTADIQLATLKTIEAGELRLANLFYNTGSKQEYGIESLAFNGFNPSQNQAINHLMSKNPFHIIHGPPGTGKTKTLVQAILQLAASGKKIMVAAPSNAAVDHITHAIAQENSAIVRMGNSFKISEKAFPFTLKSQVLNSPFMDVVKRLKKDSEAIRKKAYKYKRNFDKEAYAERKRLRFELKEIRRDIRKMEQDMSLGFINGAQIITGTFIGLQDKKLRHLQVDAVFVDEAGQAVEPSIWTVAHYAPQLFMAGDPLQLPPTLFTNKAKGLGLGISLIEQGIKLNIPTTLLDVQYRMNHKIMQFSNDYFYEGKLTAHASVSVQTLKEEQYEPIEFIDTAGCGYNEQKDSSGGISNPGEIEIVQKRLTEINLENISVGIISPYRRQVALLEEEIPMQGNNAQTIDSFQGQEKELIIVSLVRSNENGIIGFLKDYRRMNVAMTRAKKKLIIIGDSATIGNDPFYQDLLDYIENNGTYRSAWEYI
ncbi:MAG: ATP-dependent RNA/DNA helicase IGHMBP2 [Crocinitomix sp.]|jgi:ATP-dependent RNA/DNA helicase IGHMBP2